jgi:Leucine-rich repeat (LRR) protein
MYIAMNFSFSHYQYLFAHKGDIVNFSGDLPYRTEEKNFIRIRRKGAVTRIDDAPYVLDLTDLNEKKALQLLSKHQAVRMVRLDRNSLNKEVIKKLRKLRGLFALSINLQEIEDKKLGLLEKLGAKISTMYLFGGDCGENCEETLKHMNNLKLLHLRCLRNANGILDAVDSSELENLALDWELSSSDIKSLCRFKKLKRLDIRSIEKKASKWLGCHNSLEAFRIRYGGMDYKQLERIEQLRILDVGNQCPVIPLGSNITSIAVSHDQGCYGALATAVQKLEKMRGLSIRQSYCNLKREEFFSKFNHLEAFVGFPIQGIDCGILTGVENLRLLDLSMSLIRDEDLERLNTSGALRNLEVLILSDNKITDRGAKELIKSRELKYLDLGTNKLTNEGVRYLSHLSKLKVLELSINPIGPGVVSLLKMMRSLESLSLSYTKVGDDDLRLLAQFKNLKVISLTGSKVTKEGVEKLRRKLPNATIYF